MKALRKGADQEDVGHAADFRGLIRSSGVLYQRMRPQEMRNGRQEATRSSSVDDARCGNTPNVGAVEERVELAQSLVTRETMQVDSRQVRIEFRSRERVFERGTQHTSFQHTHLGTQSVSLFPNPCLKCILRVLQQVFDLPIDIIP